MSGPPPLSGAPVVAVGIFLMVTGAVMFAYPHQTAQLSAGFTLRKNPLNSWGLFTGRAFYAGQTGFGLGLALGAGFAPTWTLPLAVGLAFVLLVAGMWYSVFADSLS